MIKNSLYLQKKLKAISNTIFLQNIKNQQQNDNQKKKPDWRKLDNTSERSS